MNNIIEFVTKRNPYSYKGDILNYMFGIDLSCNRFTGEIPLEFGKLGALRAMNLSHNSLTGHIPAALSNLKKIGSLDLSSNNLNGGIPSQLVQLSFLAVFSVAYNSLSGKTPEMKGQFETFDGSSYEGHPFLCGPRLPNECPKVERSQLPNDSNVEKEDGFLDMKIFNQSSWISYIFVLLSIAVILCINQRWRRAWFYLIEACIGCCHYFVLDILHKLFRF